MPRLRALAVTGSLLTAVLASEAFGDETAALVDISGTWSISVRDRADCTFAGQATLLPTDNPAAYTAHLTMRHDCPEFGGAAIAVQKSDVSVLGKQVSVRSTIVEFPSGFSASYAPDDFALTIQSPNRMFGIQTDRYGRLPAEWVRQESGIS
ncbi:MAG: hypothetical protein AAF613_06625 [Pseudomonadota bacterium]